MRYTFQIWQYGNIDNTLNEPSTEAVRRIAALLHGTCSTRRGARHGRWCTVQSAPERAVCAQQGGRTRKAARERRGWAAREEQARGDALAVRHVARDGLGVLHGAELGHAAPQ